MANPLLERLKKNSTIKETALISESSVYHDRESIPTDIPILNLALSGRFDGGIECGLTGLAAPSKHFKTNIMLKCVSAYMTKHQDAVCLFYDSEFGSPAKYFESFDIDVERVIHTPITTVEELRSDITNQLEAINTGDKIIIIIDSIGNLASRKETEDALEQKEKSDMTRAKTLKSLFRIITPKLNLKKVPCIYINHTIETIEMFSKTVMTGGTGALYSSNTLLFITKAQEKDGKELEGFKFTLVAEKSRTVREKSKFPLVVTFDKGIHKYSGLLDVAMQTGHVVKPSMGWYSRVIDGVQEEQKYREKDTHNDDFWNVLLNDKDFNQKATNLYMLVKDKIDENNVDEYLDGVDDYDDSDFDNLD